MTPRGRRPLARPTEELTDQGLGFDLGTILGRRQALRVFGAGAVLGVAACDSADPEPAAPASASSTGASPQEIPDETAGPYPGDGSNGPDVLEQSGIVRGDIRPSFGDASGTAEGVPMTLTLTITDLAGGRPFAGAAVYVWHCDRSGGYSLYSDGITDQNYLRGVQVANASGVVQFSSIFPACYAGRWPHIHFEVYPDRASITDDSTVLATSQVALPKDACDRVYAQSGYEASVRNLADVTLAGDNVFGDDDGALQLATVRTNETGGWSVSLTAGVDTRTEPRGGGLGGDGRPSGAPGSGGPGGAPPSGPRPSGPPPSS